MMVGSRRVCIQDGEELRYLTVCSMTSIGLNGESADSSMSSG